MPLELAAFAPTVNLEGNLMARAGQWRKRTIRQGPAQEPPERDARGARSRRTIFWLARARGARYRQHAMLRQPAPQPDLCMGVATVHSAIFVSRPCSAMPRYSADAKIGRDADTRSTGTLPRGCRFRQSISTIWPSTSDTRRSIRPASSMLWVAISIATPRGPHQLHQRLEDVVGGSGIEIAGRLVRQQDPRRVGDRARDRDPLLLAAGQFRRPVGHAVARGRDRTGFRWSA